MDSARHIMLDAIVEDRIRQSLQQPERSITLKQNVANQHLKKSHGIMEVVQEKGIAGVRGFFLKNFVLLTGLNPSELTMDFTTLMMI